MKERGRENSGSRRLCQLAVLLLMIIAFFGVGIFPAPNVYAAEKKTDRILFTDESGRYLEKKGKSWFLRDNQNRPLSGVQYFAVPASKPFQKGFYYTDSNGRLCTKQDFHKVNHVAEGKTFRGTYYFGEKNGRLHMKRGWITIKNKKYYLSSSGRRYENCWKSGYYLLGNGTIAKNQKVPDGSYVDCDGRKCKKEEMALSSLKKNLQNTINSYPGIWSVYVKNLKTGDVVMINDKAMYPASTIKAFVMASVYDQISQKKIKKTSQVDRLLQNMITVSDNESYNQLVRLHNRSHSFVSGAAAVNRYLKKNGYTKTGCHSTLHPSSSSFTSDGKRNTASAKDSGLLLEKIYRGKCVNARYSKEMRNLLLKQTRRWKIPAGLPAGIKSANKTGETSSVQHDMAIVYGKKTDYVLCVFSSGVSEGSAISGIRKISEKVYNFLN